MIYMFAGRSSKLGNFPLCNSRFLIIRKGLKNEQPGGCYVIIVVPASILTKNLIFTADLPKNNTHTCVFML